MCKSIAEGGRRCVGHTRKEYHEAMQPVYRGEQLTEAIKAKLLIAATRYASTPAGANEVEADIERVDFNADGSQVSLEIGLASPILERALEAGIREKQRVDDVEASIKASKPPKARKPA